MCCAFHCFSSRSRLQKGYKLLLHCAPGYKPTQNNQEIHSLRGLPTTRDYAGRGRTGCQHSLDPGFSHRKQQQHPMQDTIAMSDVSVAVRGCSRGWSRGFLVRNRPISKEHS